MQSDKMKGFTLIELLVVISIIGFFASIVMSSLQSAREKTYDAEIQTHMSQIKNALELYANENNFTYPDPQVEVAQSDTETFTVKNRVEKFLSFLIPEKVYAQSQSSRNRNCVRFDNLSSVLVPKYIGQIPRHPLDDGFNVCYQYFKSQSMNTAVAYGPLVSETYSQGNSKQVGVVLGETEVESLMAICTDILEDTDTGTPYPLFTGPDHCSGEVADDVLGVVDGEGDVLLVESCSLPEYGDQEECEANRSTCSDDQYTSAGQEACEANGVYEDDYCEGDVSIESEEECEEAGYYDGGSCSDSQFEDKISCEGAEIWSESHCDGGAYSDEASCESAGYSEGQCNGGSYFTDESSCVGASYESNPGYCDAPYVIYTEHDCLLNNGTWTPPEYTSYGYQWTPGTESYGYQWIPGQMVNAGHVWDNGTWIPYNYEWTDGAYTPNVWNAVEPGVWGVY